MKTKLCESMMTAEHARLAQGMRVLVTGAGKGIGREVALAFAQNGANLCLASRTKAEIDEVAQKISTSYNAKAFSIPTDIENAEEVHKLIDQALTNLGGLDVAVCAAGYPLTTDLWDRKLYELDEGDFLKVFNVDLLGSFRVAKYLIPHFLKQKSGVIILFSSTPAVAGYDKGGPYTIAKAAMLGLAKEIASEFGAENVRSYAIAPGNIKTSSTFDKLSVEQQTFLADESPMKRWGDPTEVANLCVALASNYFSFVTGQTIVVDGGTVMI